MASGRDAVQMTPAEVADFLGANLKVQIATNGHDGWPHLTTLFYVLDGAEIAFWTYGRSQKIRNLQRDSRITALVEAGAAYEELRGVSVQGRARLVTDYTEISRIGAAVVAAMTGGVDLGELGEQIVAAQARKRVAVVIEPERVLSWDHSKMTAPPGAGKDQS